MNTLTKIKTVSMQEEIPISVLHHLGPQWLEITELIMRASTLAETKATALYAAKDAEAWKATWTAAYAAAWNVMRNPAVATARGRAWDMAEEMLGEVVWEAARGVAQDAVWALLIRDLIDEQAAWNQAAYDTLTRPWRTVVGKIHIQDGEMK